MATRGFEFAYDLGGGGATPVSRDFTLGVSADHKVGDLMVMQADGYIDADTGDISEVTCIMAEAVDSGDVTAGTTKAKAYVASPMQVWRCSMDAASTSAVVGNTKTIDLADKNTLDADDLVNGSAILADTDVDDEGNVLAYVTFADTTFGNA